VIQLRIAQLRIVNDVATLILGRFMAINFSLVVYLSGTSQVNNKIKRNILRGCHLHFICL